MYLSIYLYIYLYIYIYISIYLSLSIYIYIYTHRYKLSTLVYAAPICLPPSPEALLPPPQRLRTRGRRGVARVLGWAWACITMYVYRYDTTSTTTTNNNDDNKNDNMKVLSGFVCYRMLVVLRLQTCYTSMKCCKCIIHNVRTQCNQHCS